MASPLINNVLNNANLNQPISAYVENAGEEEPDSIFLMLTSQLSLSEMLAIM
jgi:hypothetical protein